MNALLAPLPRALRPSVASRLRSPFDPDDAAAYLRWREAKLRAFPSVADAIIVEVRDPLQLSEAERAALADRIRRAGAAVYAGPANTAEYVARRIGEQLGMRRLDRNWLADDDGVSRLRVRPGTKAGDFIPYTNRPLSWHTDGYYNPPERRIRGLVLHCIQDACSGGENQLLDHEIAYLRLRDADPGAVWALMRGDAMTIPERTDEQGVARGAQAGPVFAVDEDGRLQMRYTARTRSIEWRNDVVTRAAAAAIEALLAGGAPELFTLHLRPGMGIVGGNILHRRAGFDDDARRPRLLLRARFFDAPDLS